MTHWIATGDRPSNGARELASQPGFKRLRTGRWVRPRDTIVNWGSSTIQVPDVRVLNRPDRVAVASNKLRAFELMMGNCQTVEWTADKAVAQQWSNDGKVVVARQLLTGHSGNGIIIVSKNTPDIPNAPLYTKYIFKEKEYRVHAVHGVSYDTQRKIKDPDREVTDWKVRSHDNGFIFARNGIVQNDERDDRAVYAFLDFKKRRASPAFLFLEKKSGTLRHTKKSGLQTGAKS